ncbi:unnamed protein product [Lactuca virosa]|uniref:Protein kinase domain-containing protein n=1 Tax=Lactuca virosa TaxID=75947 RepID=A0AAU9LQT3_9ASTR|nr:unnamed protein product [Lactuca virosa]
MQKYEKIEEIGSGTYGVVWRALNKKTGEVVAVKKLYEKYTSMEECTNLIEVKALRQMNHPNIVKLKEIHKENDFLYLVFECMECSLYDRMKNMAAFSESEIRNLCFQLFQGLAYMHGKGYFHRDLKPDNLLVSSDVIKIADLGQARESNRKPPYTVDMWAMGAIMAELYTNQRLFKGNSGGEVFYKICSVIGSPTESKWKLGLQLAVNMNYQFPDLPGVPLASLLPSASSEALCLIAALLSWNPCMRPTAMEALKHPFFHSCYHVPLPIHRNQDLPWKKALLTQTRSRKSAPIVSEKVNKQNLIRMLQEKFIVKSDR